MNTKTYRKIVRASAIYDILVTFPFALPGLAEWNLAQIKTVHTSFAFSGSIPDFAPFHLFFVNLMGSLVMVWSILRVYKPEPILGLYDSFARVLFSLWMLYYLLIHNVTGVLWLFFAPEISWGAIQIYGYLTQDRLLDKTLQRTWEAKEIGSKMTPREINDFQPCEIWNVVKHPCFLI